MTNTLHPITEDDIAHYLANTPDFFERHAELLGAVQLTSPHGKRAVSLQERQAEILREKIKVLEQRIMGMMRHSNENAVIAERVYNWARSLLLVVRARALPPTLVGELQNVFMVPQVSIKIWDVDERYLNEPYSMGATEDAKSLASSLTQPYCGLNSGFEAVRWLGDPTTAMSVALLPLREAPAKPAFGMLVLASPDPQRFNADMGTDFLERIAELASAALARLRPANS
jgi:uncharacterized protein YigA (DUF484 family)